MSRAKANIFEYAMCNEWQYFITLTLDRKKYDRYDLGKYRKDLSQWLRDYSKKHKIKIAYLFIPEYHKNKAWHIHGLLEGLPEEHLTDFIKGKHPQRLIDEGYKNWTAYGQKFGYVTVGYIKSKEAISRYITKEYITKGMAERNKELNAHLYYVSQGLKKAEIIKKGTMTCANIAPDWQNEWVKINWIKDKTLALASVE
jgi:hypothetical protein